MDKILFWTRLLLFQVVIILFYLSVKLTGFTGLAEAIFGLMLIFYELLYLEDIIRKSEINKNKRYNILSCLVFAMIIVILLRCLGDPHFIYHDKAFVKELYEFETALYGQDIDRTRQFIDMIQYYLINNVVYFNIMFVLLFIYRKITLNIKKN